MLTNNNETRFKEHPPFKELRRYSESDLKEIVGDNDSLIKDLQKYDYIKFDKEKDEYVFKFVGVILIDNMVFKSYPKYIPDNIIDAEDNEQKKKDFKETMRVIRKYHKQKVNFNQDMTEFEDPSSSMLSLMLFFIEDYYENGIYTNYQIIHELNGNGEINWNRTINNHNPILKKKNKKLYYTELETRYNMNNINNYFRLLHEFIITDCSKILKKVGLLDIFDLTPVELSYKKIDEFGDKKEILEKLEKERRVEFNTHKRKLLKYMYYYIANEKTFANKDIISVYGTSSYHVIWEDICCRVLKDKLNHEIRKEIPNKNLSDKKYKNEKLKEIIEKPKWKFKGEKPIETAGLVPDLITFDNDIFVILDAKYYDIIFEEEELIGQPGLESVTKQYLYELAYKEFICDAGFDNVRNAFLFPRYDSNPIEEQKVINKGCVQLKFLTDIPLEEIQVVMLPVSRMNKLYLQNKPMDISELELES